MSSFLSSNSKAKSKAQANPKDNNGSSAGNATQNNASAAGLATHVAEIGNMGRTHFEGLMTPTEHQNVAHLNTVVPAPRAQGSKASQAPRFTNAGADMGTGPAANKAPASALPTFAVSQYASDSPQASQTVGYFPQASKNATNSLGRTHLTNHSTRASQYTSNHPQASQYGSPATHYKATLPLPSQLPLNSRSPGVTTNKETFKPSIKATILTNPPPTTLASVSQPNTSISRTTRPSANTQLPISTTKTNQQHSPPLPLINVISPTSCHGPIKTTSVFTSPTDQRMALLQPTISRMPLNSTARKTQEKWAQSIIPTLAANTCPEGNKFNHIPSSKSNIGGYQCSGGRHFISDDLIASGSQGVYLLLDPSDTSYLAGPYYPSSSDPSTLLYSGGEPKMPPHAPDWISGAYKGNFNPKTKEKENVRIGRTIIGRATDKDILNIARGLGVTGLSAREAREKCEEFVNSTG